MGRPSKLTDSQWEELERLLASGERTVTELAKRYKVSKGAISKRVSKQAEVSKQLARSLVEVEAKIEVLPVSQQRVIRNLADSLKAIQEHYSAAAEDGAAGAAHLQRLARQKAERLDQNASGDEIRTVAQLSETARSMAGLATTLITANKGKAPEGAGTLESLITGDQP